MTPVRLEPAALRSRVKHSTTEPLRSLPYMYELSSGQDPLNKLSFPHPKESPNEILVVWPFWVQRYIYENIDGQSQLYTIRLIEVLAHP